MRSVIKISKTVEDAVREALAELKVREDQVEVKVLEEPSKGLFGIIGVKEAKVKITVVKDEVEVANQFLEKLLHSMNIKANCDIRKEGSNLFVDIRDLSSSDMGIIIGKRGNTLDSIQYLLSLIVNKDRDDYLKVVVDTENYREKREETLIRLANKMAEKAKYSKRPIKLEPMNPYERRIIHSTLQNVEGVTTYSEGDEPYRRVVIQSR